jgi:hypothetical protein
MAFGYPEFGDVSPIRWLAVAVTLRPNASNWRVWFRELAMVSETHKEVPPLMLFPEGNHPLLLPSLSVVIPRHCGYGN